VSSVDLGLRSKTPSAVELKIRIPSRITPREAITLQEKLAPLVKETSELPSEITHLVGCDAAYVGGRTVAAATLVDYEKLELDRIRTARERTRFPYIPGLLAFREGPSVLRAIKSLGAQSYVCLVDAHGLAHPRRFGLACFVGLVLDRPTIGVAKSLLYGSVREDQVFDKEGRQIAEIVPLPGSGKVIYVSVGHKISLKDAIRIVSHCLTQRGPVPITVAHEEVTRQKWLLLKKSNPVSS
jgi:deoxyribonuclease V